MTNQDINPEIDRSGWGEGPWDGEPDLLIWTSKEGMPLMARRNQLGNWCGYCGVHTEHPAYGAHYDDVDDIYVHGGLTYAGPDPEFEGIRPNLWYFGFDCAHAGDYIPGLPITRFTAFPPDNLVEYRTLEYVKLECERLAEQLKRTTQDQVRDTSYERAWRHHWMKYCQTQLLTGRTFAEFQEDYDQERKQYDDQHNTTDQPNRVH